MKLQKFKENNPRKKGIIVFSVIGIVLLAIVVFSNTFAIYEDIKKFNIISGTVSNLGEAIFFYHLPDGSVTALSSRIDSSLTLDEDRSTCNYGVVPKWVNGAISLDKTNATNTSSQKIRCEAYMKELTACRGSKETLEMLSKRNSNYVYTENNSKCLSVDENGMILDPNSSSIIMSDEETPIICSMEDDYGTSYYLRGNHHDNNVVFANMCWKLIRVTGTGGLKLIYNGDLDANGKCTITSGNHSGFEGQTLSLSGNKLYGTSYTKEGSTYTLTDTSTIDWASDSASIIGKYTCGNTSTSCANPYYVVSSENSTTAYVLKMGVSTNYAQIGKSSFNPDTVSPALVGYMYNDVYENFSKNLSNNTNNYYYGESFIYNDGIYTLNNTVQFSDISDYTNTTLLYTHHYTCFKATDNTCQELYYIYKLGSTSLLYIKLNGNETGPEALNKMVNNNDINVKDSTIKKFIDGWYAMNIKGTQYERKLEDTIFCNDRTIDDLGGWSETGNIYNSSNTDLKFNGGGKKYYLKCPSKRDAFTVSDSESGNSALTYPVGLLTTAEHILTGNYTTNKTGDDYWASNPRFFDGYVSYEDSLPSSSGDWKWGIDYVSYNAGVRPTLSLQSCVDFKAGTGAAEDPYVVG